MRRGILGVACLLVLVLALAGSAEAARYDAHTVIVKFTNGVSAKQRSALFSATGVTGRRGSVRGVGAAVVRVKGDPAGTAKRLNRSALVAYAEPNIILKATATPNDPLYPQLYGLTTRARPAAGRTPTSTRPRAGTRPGSAPSRLRAARRSASSTPASTRPIPS
jgi:hypothetical protein